MTSPNTIKFSQFQKMSYSNSTNMLVGTNAAANGNNVITPFPPSWTTATRPSMPATGVLGFNTGLGQYEYWNGAAWVQLSAGGSGTVNVGAINQLAYYAANGSAVSGLMGANNSVLTSNNTGVPSWNTTLPGGLTIPQPIIQGITSGTSAASGVVGEFIASQVGFGSPVSLVTTTETNLTTLLLQPGDYDVWGNVNFIIGGNCTNIQGAISLTSATLPDPSQRGQLQTSTPVLTAENGVSCPPLTVTISVATTIYLIAYAVFTTSTVSAIGGIYARRRR